MWHSLYSTDGACQIIGGITEEIEQKLLARGEARLLGKTDKSVGCYLNVAAGRAAARAVKGVACNG